MPKGHRKMVGLNSSTVGQQGKPWLRANVLTGLIVFTTATAEALHQLFPRNISHTAANGFMLGLPSFVHCRSIKDEKMFQTLHQFTHHAFHKTFVTSQTATFQKNTRTSTTMPATTNLETASPATTKQVQLGKSNITATIINGARPFHNTHHGDLRLQLCNIQYIKDLHAVIDDKNCRSK